MAGNNIFSYTKRDYEGSRKEGLSQIPVLSKGEWTDLNATDPGIVILDYVHALVDMVQYYQDHQALETFITTAKERKNIFRLAKQLDYNIRGAEGAIVAVEFTSPLVYDYTIKIPKYTPMSTESGIKYLTSEDAYLLAGEHVVSVPCVQGELITTTYRGTGISRYSAVSGAANQVFRLIDNNIDINSIEIVDNIGRVWNSLEYIIFSTEYDRAYQVDLNPDNSVSILFGDGERGIVPKETDILTISYITNDAEDGRVGENEITVLESEILNDNGQYVDFMISNPSASSGGTSPQSSQEIRDLAPGAIKAQDRAVTLADFENLAKLVDGVLDAKAYDINTKPDLCLYHEVKVLIIPKESVSSPELLVTEVNNYLSKRMIPPTNLQILTPSYEEVDIDIVVRMMNSTTEGRLSYEIEQVVTNYFNELRGNIGEPFYPSDLLAVLSRMEDIRTIVSMTPNTAIQVEDLSVIKLGSLSITVE